MDLFRRYQSNEPSEPTPPSTDQEVTEELSSSQVARKKAPTPSRRQAEAERRDRLHPTLSKREMKARERELSKARQNKAWAKVESSPERVLMRNFVDSKWSFSEFVWPLMFITLAAMLAAAWLPRLAQIANYAVYAMIVVVTVEVAITWYRYKNILNRRHPGTPKRGLLAAMISRMITMRRFRRPGTAIDRGGSY